MQITGAFRAAAFAAVQAALRGTSAAPAAATSAPGTPAAATDISTYDFRRTTPAQMKAIAKDLYDSGRITLDQTLMLQTAGVPIGHNVNGRFQPLSDAERADHENRPFDYLATFEEGLRFLEQRGETSTPTSAYGSYRDILAVLREAQGAVGRVDLRA